MCRALLSRARVQFTLSSRLGSCTQEQLADTIGSVERREMRINATALAPTFEKLPAMVAKYCARGFTVDVGAWDGPEWRSLARGTADATLGSLGFADLQDHVDTLQRLLAVPDGYDVARGWPAQPVTPSYYSRARDVLVAPDADVRIDLDAPACVCLRFAQGAIDAAVRRLVMVRQQPPAAKREVGAVSSVG